MDISKLVDGLDLIDCVEFDASMLTPEAAIRAYCEQDKCGSYGKSYMCPPDIGTLTEIETGLRHYNRGLLLRYSEPIEMKKENAGKIQKSKNTFNKKVLEVEKRLHDQGIENVWGLFGGTCGICRTCKKIKGKPCKHPEKARPSLEALGISVSGVLEKLELDAGFHKDRITWTGCVLYTV